MQKAICLLTLLANCLMAPAQSPSFNLALRWIKVGNTLREAKQYAQANDYLDKAMKVVQGANDRYWIAAIHEHKALIFRDRNDKAQAAYYLGKALEGYRATGASTSAQVVRQIQNGLKDNQELYGGIDIGSKGVKLSVIGLKFSPGGKPDFRVIRSESRNTAAIECSTTAFAETAKAVRAYVDTLLTRRKIPRNRVFVVGSSGLKTELAKCGKEAELLQALKTELGAAWPDPISFIDAATEAELTVRGTLSESEWLTSATIDIGSGNTKGGYYTTDGKFEYADLLGTGAVTKLMQGTGKPVAEVAQAVYDDELKLTVSREMSRKPELQNRKRLYLLGGIVYALTTYLHAAEINDPLVKFTYKDAVRLQELAIKDYEALTAPDLSAIDNEAVYKMAQSEVRNVREKVFTRDQLIAGATLLRGVMEECRRNNPNEKEFIFHRNGVIGWISGYIIREMEKDYQQTKEQ